MRYEFIVAERVRFPVRLLCRLVGVATSAFYAWLAKARRSIAGPGLVLVAEIGQIFEASSTTYGSPRVHAELVARGHKISRKRVERLMRDNGLAVPKRKKRKPFTTNSDHDLPVSRNLLERNFEAAAADRVWLADITYIPTDEGWLYLAGIKDMATCEIVGWAMADHLRAELCERALIMAIQRRQPLRDLIHHSDRGVQYASTSYRAILARHGITQSMSRRGNCHDNAPMESFFGSLKTELVHRTRFRTRAEARQAIFRWIETYYNRRRRHSSLGYLTPAQAFEQMARAA